MTSLIEVLPFDIIETIVYLLAIDSASDHPSQNETLQACSLTCQTLLPLCQKQIFCFVLIRDVESKAALVKLIQHSQHTPRFFEYVRKLDYLVEPTDWEASGPTSIVALLKHFTKLSSFMIDFQVNWIAGCYNNWTKIPPEVRSTFLSLMTLPTITSLEIHGNLLEFDHIGLLPSTSLRELRLNCVGFADWDDSPPVNTTAKSIKLHKLDISFDQSVEWVATTLKPYFEDGTSTLDLRELKYLKALSSYDLSLVAEICKKTHLLETLVLTFMCASCHIYVLAFSSE